MKLKPIALAVRITLAEQGEIGQPEYYAGILRQWAQMPIKSYFGSHKKAQERLFRLLDLDPDDNPSYQAVAYLVYHSSANNELLDLLSIPLQAYYRDNCCLSQ